MIILIKMGQTHFTSSCCVAGTNPQGLYFRLGNTTLLPESSVLFSDIGHHPHDRADPGSTLVCVTTNVNQHCCRGADGGNVGEWYYPDGSQVPRPFSTENPTLFRVGYTHQLRLGTEGDPVGPFGVYTCEVPNSSGIKVNATIFINGLLSGMFHLHNFLNGYKNST